MASASPAALPAERRLMTIMFCDLVGSTALASRLDPEDLRDVLTAYQQQATAVVKAAGGSIARYQGDGVLAYFGYPTAGEDDAERAVSAGLQLALGIDGGDKAPDQLRVRVGIATGVVLAGERSSSSTADSPEVVGETVNLAARLQELADPNAVVICDNTHRLVGGLFEYDDLGLRRAKGLSEPMQTWRVLKRSRIASRFQALRSRALPYVGRKVEIAYLLARWTQARAGAGCVAVISGDAGIGKSRAVLELAATARRDPTTVLRYDCSPQHQNSMLHPILEQMRRTARSQPEELAATLRRLESVLPDRSEQANAAIAWLSELMAPSAGKAAPETELDAKHRRELVFEAMIGNLRQLAGERPLLIVVEDAHWIDPTSGDLLDRFVTRMAAWPIMLVVTCRPQYQPVWHAEPHVVESRAEAYCRQRSASPHQAHLRRR